MGLHRPDSGFVASQRSASSALLKRAVDCDQHWYPLHRPPRRRNVASKLSSFSATGMDSEAA